MQRRIERFPRRRSMSGIRLLTVGLLLLIAVGLIAILVLNPQQQTGPIEIPVLFSTDPPAPLLESLPWGDYQVFAVGLHDGWTEVNIRTKTGASWGTLPAGYKPESSGFEQGCLLRVNAEGMTLIMPSKDSLSCSTS